MGMFSASSTRKRRKAPRAVKLPKRPKRTASLEVWKRWETNCERKVQEWKRKNKPYLERIALEKKKAEIIDRMVTHVTKVKAGVRG